VGQGAGEEEEEEEEEAPMFASRGGGVKGGMGAGLERNLESEDESDERGGLEEDEEEGPPAPTDKQIKIQKWAAEMQQNKARGKLRDGHKQHSTSASGGTPTVVPHGEQLQAAIDAHTEAVLQDTDQHLVAEAEEGKEAKEGVIEGGGGGVGGGVTLEEKPARGGFKNSMAMYLGGSGVEDMGEEEGKCEGGQLQLNLLLVNRTRENDVEGIRRVLAQGADVNFLGLAYEGPSTKLPPKKRKKAQYGPPPPPHVLRSVNPLTRIHGRASALHHAASLGLF